VSGKEDFRLGAVGGALVWLAYFGTGNKVVDSPGLLDGVIGSVFPDVAMFKALIFYVMFGGIFSVIVGQILRGRR